MVRVSGDLLEQEDHEAMEVDLLEDGDEPAENSEASQQRHPEDPGQQNQVGNPSPESLEVVDLGQKDEQPPVLEDVDAEEEDSESFVSGSPCQTKQTRSFKCKYCPLSTPDLSLFKEHVDSNHPNVILNPLYLCTVCNFNTNKFDSLTDHNVSQHPGETNFKFKRLKMNRQTILEQNIEGQGASVQGNDWREHVDPTSLFSTAVKTPESIGTVSQQKDPSPLDQLIQKDQITAVTINGTVIIPEPTSLRGLSHVAPLLQRPPNIHRVPKVAVPLNTTKYNPSLDHNATLITSFNRFPYPTHAELSWLTAASKHPEEQIKVWFTTQRLKQGITWSPEEVEEARKKMFNGSLPPAHHTFAVPPAQPPLVRAAVGQWSLARTTATTGRSAVTATRSLNGGTGGPGSAHKRAQLTAVVFGPEPKRPVVAVAPHSGEDRILMAPPPPPPQRDRLPLALPPVEMRPVALPVGGAEMKRPSATVPSTPSPPSPSKGKIPSVLGNAKTKPVVSLPSIVFPESLTTPMIAPPPFAAPPFKNALLIPLSSAIASKETHAAADQKLPTSPPVIAPHMRRPPIIHSLRAPAQIPCFPLDREHQGLDLGCSRRDALLVPEANGASDYKWPQDLSSPAPDSGIMECGGPPQADLQQKSSVLTQFPLLERMKGKTAEQLKVLEEYFLRNSFPTQSDVDNLAGATQLSPQEISSWFVERRALRDNLEQALLNSMGAKSAGGLSAVNKKMKQQQTQQPNGIHKPGAGVAPAPPPTLPPGAPGPSTPSFASPDSCSVPPDSQSATLLEDSLAPWPSPEECRTGPARPDLTCWFHDGHLYSGSTEMADHFLKNGVNGGQGPPLRSPESAPSSLVRRCQEGGSAKKMLEAEFGRLMEQRANDFSGHVHEELQRHFTDR